LHPVVFFAEIFEDILKKFNKAGFFAGKLGDHGIAFIEEILTWGIILLKEVYLPDLDIQAFIDLFDFCHSERFMLSFSAESCDSSSSSSLVLNLWGEMGGEVIKTLMCGLKVKNSNKRMLSGNKNLHTKKEVFETCPLFF
jgi:hypothetical protein